MIKMVSYPIYLVKQKKNTGVHTSKLKDLAHILLKILHDCSKHSIKLVNGVDHSYCRVTKYQLYSLGIKTITVF